MLPFAGQRLPFFVVNGVDHAIDLGVLVGNQLKIERVATGRGAGRNSPLFFLWFTPLTKPLTFPLPGTMAGGSHPLWIPVAFFMVAPCNHPRNVSRRPCIPPLRLPVANLESQQRQVLSPTGGLRLPLPESRHGSPHRALCRPKGRGRSFPRPRASTGVPPPQFVVSGPGVTETRSSTSFGVPIISTALSRLMSSAFRMPSAP